jgi:PhnB protein
MPTTLNPYLGFRNNARQAMEFYRDVFGGNLNISTYADFPGGQNPGAEKLIMHAELRTDNGITLMGSDAPPGMDHDEGSSISISLSGENESELRGYWEKLKAGGNITMPLDKAPWGDTFGMLTDKFGTNWLVNIAGPKA